MESDTIIFGVSMNGLRAVRDGFYELKSTILGGESKLIVFILILVFIGSLSSLYYRYNAERKRRAMQKFCRKNPHHEKCKTSKVSLIAIALFILFWIALFVYGYFYGEKA